MFPPSLVPICWPSFEYRRPLILAGLFRRQGMEMAPSTSFFVHAADAAKTIMCCAALISLLSFQADASPGSSIAVFGLCQS